jgi:hypothetical protein
MRLWRLCTWAACLALVYHIAESWSEIARWLACGIIVGTKWSEYELADVVKGYRASVAGGWDATQAEYERKFPGSIVARYLARTHEAQQLGVLARIVREKRRLAPGGSLPGSRAVVVHLRLGDVVDHAGDVWNFDAAERAAFEYAGYVKPRQFYQAVSEQLRARLPPAAAGDAPWRIILVGSAQQAPKWFKPTSWFHSGSAQYVVHVAKLFRERYGFNVTTRMEGTPDEDTVFMASARYLVTSGGGFSKLMAEIACRMGGTVYGLPHGALSLQPCSARSRSAWSTTPFGDGAPDEPLTEEGDSKEAVACCHVVELPEEVASRKAGDANLEEGTKGTKTKLLANEKEKKLSAQR